MSENEENLKSVSPISDLALRRRLYETMILIIQPEEERLAIMDLLVAGRPVPITLPPSLRPPPEPEPVPVQKLSGLENPPIPAIGLDKPSVDFGNIFAVWWDGRDPDDNTGDTDSSSDYDRTDTFNSSEYSDDDNSSDNFPVTSEWKEENLLLKWDAETIPIELQWNQCQMKDIIPKHIALFKACFRAFYRDSDKKTQRGIYAAISRKRLLWLAEPLPANSNIEVPEKELAWVVIWSILKYVRMMMVKGGGIIKENKFKSEISALITAMALMLRQQPIYFIMKALASPNPTVYFTPNGKVVEEKGWFEDLVEKTGGTCDEVFERFTKSNREKFMTMVATFNVGEDIKTRAARDRAMRLNSVLEE
ncbi:hypothetical protein ABW20_dc0106649 [Dactylellina cionopaga]|nr:hypothetical protein ABW20_dc0106649 [Dactylellina cionopaga]